MTLPNYPAVVFITGKESKERLNWDALAKLNATVVILEILTLKRNVERLLKHGMDPNTPVAIVENGYTRK
jgi:uroporphyrin-III C-methyltransferase